MKQNAKASKLIPCFCQWILYSYLFEFSIQENDFSCLVSLHFSYAFIFTFLCCKIPENKNPEKMIVSSVDKYDVHTSVDVVLYSRIPQVNDSEIHLQCEVNLYEQGTSAQHSDVYILPVFFVSLICG